MMNEYQKVIMDIIDRTYERAVLRSDPNTKTHIDTSNMYDLEFLGQFSYLTFNLGRQFGHTTIAHNIISRYRDSVYLTKSSSMLYYFINQFNINTDKSRTLRFNNAWLDECGKNRFGYESPTFGYNEIKGHTVEPISIMVLDECETTKKQVLEFINANAGNFVAFPKVIVSLGTPIG